MKLTAEHAQPSAVDLIAEYFPIIAAQDEPITLNKDAATPGNPDSYAPTPG